MVLHATMWIKCGFASGNGLVLVAIALSFFLITVFFLNGLSIVMVVEYNMLLCRLVLCRLVTPLGC